MLLMVLLHEHGRNLEWHPGRLALDFLQGNSGATLTPAQAVDLQKGTAPCIDVQECCQPPCRRSLLQSSALHWKTRVHRVHRLQTAGAASPVQHEATAELICKASLNKQMAFSPALVARAPLPIATFLVWPRSIPLCRRCCKQRRNCSPSLASPCADWPPVPRTAVAAAGGSFLRPPPSQHQVQLVSLPVSLPLAHTQEVL
mmetsp:Transcript_52864/g.115357  ORF Transcript_52864/g.115357 Transcript_52864/m.115357 type:complete len:201 (+) Transcript_52864:230-832(+)